MPWKSNQSTHVPRSHPPSPRTFHSQVTKNGSTYPLPKGLSCSPDVTWVMGSRGGGAGNLAIGTLSP